LIRQLHQNPHWLPRLAEEVKALRGSAGTAS
jgi:hypothetical protein